MFGPRSRRHRGADPAAHIAASYSRYSSDKQDESSIEQQQRNCRGRAKQDGVTIPNALEFSDFAISGTKRERAGLNAMLIAARAGKFRTIYFDSLSRLARESIITMPILKELVYKLRIRVVSVSEGIDSSMNNWDMMATFLSLFHEQFLKTLRAAVLRGQEHTVLNDWSAGDWCFGYDSVPIEGTATSRRGRDSKPRMRVVVCPKLAEWVRVIFNWFVVEKRKMDWIARELTKLGVPKDHRSTTPGWHHDQVRGVLRNEKYIGLWLWGKKTNMRDPTTGNIFQEDRPAEEVAQWTRERPDLRIIEDDLFIRAQVMLDELKAKWADCHNEKGHFNGLRPEPAASRHILQGLFKCGRCGKNFHVWGAFSTCMGCSGYRRGLCTVPTRLSRALATKLILKVIGDRVLGDSVWLDRVCAEAERAWKQPRVKSETGLDEAQQQLAAESLAMKRLLDLAEKAGEEIEELTVRIRGHAARKKDLERQVAMLKVDTAAEIGPPTREWIEGEIRRLHEVLQAGGADANAALKQLVGGSITLNEMEAPGRKRKYLVGTFALQTQNLLPANSAALLQAVPESGPTGEPITIEFREPPPWAALADQVKERVEAMQSYKQIAEALNCTEQWAAKARAWWYTSRGLTVPDGRTEMVRPSQPTLAEVLSDQVKELLDQNIPLKEIADILHCSRHIVTAAMQQWYSSRGLPIPDGRHRRKEVTRARKSAVIANDGKSTMALNQIALDSENEIAARNTSQPLEAQRSPRVHIDDSLSE